MAVCPFTKAGHDVSQCQRVAASCANCPAIGPYRTPWVSCPQWETDSSSWDAETSSPLSHDTKGYEYVRGYAPLIVPFNGGIFRHVWSDLIPSLLSQIYVLVETCSIWVPHICAADSVWLSKPSCIAVPRAQLRIFNQHSLKSYTWPHTSSRDDNGKWPCFPIPEIDASSPQVLRTNSVNQ